MTEQLTPRKATEERILGIHEPPPTSLSLRYCPVCGRTDRFEVLPEPHYRNGRRCDGLIRVARYRLATSRRER